MRTYFHVKGGRLEEVKGEVVREQPLTVHVNGERFVTLLCSPFQLEALVVGYLWMEKVIEDLSEISRLDISEVDGRAEVTLSRAVTLPTERILTSGCGGGITFRIDPRLFPRLHSSLRVQPGQLAARLKDLFGRAVHYHASRGIHGAALADGERAAGGRGGRRASQRGRQGEGRGDAPGHLDGGPRAPLHRADLVGDAAQGRPHGRAGRRLADVARPRWRSAWPSSSASP